MYAEMSYDQCEDKAQNHNGRPDVHDNLEKTKEKKNHHPLGKWVTEEGEKERDYAFENNHDDFPHSQKAFKGFPRLKYYSDY